jgi:CDP-diacylglycerol--glycerol-3-phosphate 3-phosphatidyltransferase
LTLCGAQLPQPAAKGKSGLPWELSLFEAARKAYESALSAAAALLARTGVHPNTLTWISLIPAALAGFAAAGGAFVLAAVLLVCSGLFDLLDGALARSTGQTTKFGALLDSTLDRLSDAAVPAGLAVFYAPYGAIVLVPVLMIAGGFLVSYVRARAEGLGLDLPRLWMRREDRMVIMVAGLFIAWLPIPGVAMAAPTLLIVVGLLALLSFAAAVAALAAGRRG